MKTDKAVKPQAETSNTMAVLDIEKIVIESGRMKVDVRLCPQTPHHTDGLSARRALRICPTLAAHSCVNGRGPTFADIIEHTSVPHLLEHLIIDEQVRDAATLTERSFVGATEWTDEGLGRAHIEVNFFDDLVALRALKNAVALLDNIMSIQPTNEVSG